MKKALHLGLILVLMLSFLAACGKSNSSNEVEATNKPAENNAVVVEPPAEPEKVELSVFIGAPRFKEQFDKYFEKFKAQELADKNIDVTIKLEMPNPEQAKQILQTRLASGDAPDVFDVHATQDIPTYYKAGYLSDLSDQSFVGKLFPSIKDTVTYDSKVVAVPLESLSWGYLYNKKIFSDLGLTPPQTLDELNAVIAKLKENKITPFELAFQESWIPQLMMALSLGGTVSSAHPDWIEKMNKGEASYSDVSSVFDVIDLIMANGTDKPFEVGSAAGSTDFANGKAAMWVQGPWMSESILKAKPDMEFGVAPLPVSNDPAGAMINLATSTSLAVSAISKNQDAAKDLVSFMLDDKESAAFYEELKFNPVASIHTYEAFPWITEASSYVSQGKAYRDLQLPNGVTDEAAKMLQSYYAKDVTKEEMIKALDKAWAAGIKNQK